ncbi:RcpC/CpaB family pilus assembly protein [Streptomyces nigra]|uniref:RcpC/CpaB family pilus assembly protein n=1 Tax=Streptomyces nigra TaxID=1827580 RepID=UPI0034346416
MLPPGPDAPATREVPRFDPVRVRGTRYRLRRLVRHRRRAVAAGLAVTAAALVAAGPREADGARGHPVDEPVRPHRVAEPVSAPVRIADAATVRLLRPGDRVDVIAAEENGPGPGRDGFGGDAFGGKAEVVARGARVTELPEPLEATGESGALVVLSVPRATAARLAAASTTARLAVTLC